MKIGALVVALLIAASASSALAKGGDGHHARRAGGAKAVSHRSASASRNGAAAKGASDQNAGNKIDVGGSQVPLTSRDNGRIVKPSTLQIVKPKGATRAATAPVEPVIRNAIGQTSSSAAVTIKTGGLQTQRTVQGAAPADNAKPIVVPRASVNLSSRSKIDGTALIRPAFAASVGGPAKTAGGINGTLIRPKRR